MLKMVSTVIKPIVVFYTPKMVADSQSLSPSAAKPAKVVESWQEKFVIDVKEPEPVTVDELTLAHDRTYVEDVLAGRCNNGFGNRSPDVAMSLPFTSGAMLSAARHAIKTRAVACAPCSGFHHAEHHTPQGFCTFNGLMVAALVLQKEGASRVGILDLDMHYGNGTDNIIHKLKASKWIKHFTGGGTFVDVSQVDDFFSQLPGILDWMSDCDVVLYQAGADPHINDPYGGWLTTEQLRLRDAIVFEAFKTKGVPVAWNLAGGYQTERDGSIPKVLEIHDNTMRECVRVYGG
jgi:acetoin utilization deacetylase AcuC-like enzyme